MRCVNDTLPPCARARWLLRIWRLTSSSLAGTARTDVAVGTSRLASMLLTMRAAAPRNGSGVSPASTIGALPVAARRAGAASRRRLRRGGGRVPARRRGAGAARRRRLAARARSRRRSRASPPRPPRGFSWNRRYISSTMPSFGPRSRSVGRRGVAHDEAVAQCHRRTSSARRKARSSAWRAFSRGIATRLVARFEVFAAHFVAAAEALGDVVAGELDVHAARPHAVLAAAREELLDLVHHRVEVAGLVAALVHERVAVHRVARPHDRMAGALHRAQRAAGGARRRCRRPCGSRA